MSHLPIEDLLPEIRAALRDRQALVLQAPPGAGKTTLLPLALLDQPWLAGRSILMLEPRRLAARAAAVRMAELLGEPVGQRIGYRVRFESKVSARTRIEVLTEGILTRRLQGDPELEGVGLVIFDEFHERSLHADLTLALCIESQRALRADLRLLIMSATLDSTALARALGDAPVITSRGRSHPVALKYLPRDPVGDIAVTVTRSVVHALGEDEGDILAFLPGGAEIRRTHALLEREPACQGVRICPLYGDLPYADQQQAIQPDPRGLRKIVLATSIAETSLTIEGIRLVVDSGWTKIPRFQPRSGLTRLERVRVSADSAEQRAGRAGRLGPGICYRLWSERTQETLRPHRTPEILEADLATLALELAYWGISDTADLTWLDPPPAGALAQARDLLQDLEALDARARITAHGRELARLPLHPRLAHMVQRGAALGKAALACDLAALLEERDILRGEGRDDCDLSTRVEILNAFRTHGRRGAERYRADPKSCARIEQISRQWRSRLQIRGFQDMPAQAEVLGVLLALAFPDRVAKRRHSDRSRYRLANGRGARLPNGDSLAGRDWLAVAQVDDHGDEGQIFLAAPLELAGLERHLASRISTHSAIYWDQDAAAVVARQERRLGQLIITSQTLANPDSTDIRRAMMAGIRRMGVECLPWNPAIRQWQARLLSLRHWYPEQGWPDLADSTLMATLEDWLEPFLDGVTRSEHLQRLALGDILGNHLNWVLRKRMDELAPTHIRVPSGSNLRLHYVPGEAPVLAVKLQEMFGLPDTPRVAEGKIAVTLQLLSPAQRPIQITQDLRGFWERTYADVKKELKGRYPKHHWPDDPWTAVPRRHTMRRDQGDGSPREPGK